LVNVIIVRPEVITLIGVFCTSYTLAYHFETVLKLFLLSGAISGGPREQLLRAIAPNCTQLILQCIIGKAVLTGWDCCANYFDQTPYFTSSGQCFVAKVIEVVGALEIYSLKKG